jgi:hypothetical protein
MRISVVDAKNFSMAQRLININLTPRTKEICLDGAYIAPIFMSKQNHPFILEFKKL